MLNGSPKSLMVIRNLTLSICPRYSFKFITGLHLLLHQHKFNDTLYSVFIQLFVKDSLKIHCVCILKFCEPGIDALLFCVQSISDNLKSALLDD